jgi:microcystin-dependent protein
VSSPFIGEIRMFGGNFAPRSFAFCNGQLLPISQFEPLFFLIGTTYGGDGQQTFALPDLQGRVPIHQGQGPTGQTYPIGDRGGVESVTLTAQQLPLHTHALSASSAPASPTAQPGGSVTAESSAPLYAAGSLVPLAPQAISSSGASAQPHDNLAPYQCINFIICLEGIFPQRN